MARDPIHTVVAVLCTIVLSVALYGVYVAMEAGEALQAAEQALPGQHIAGASSAAPRP